MGCEGRCQSQVPDGVDLAEDKVSTDFVARIHVAQGLPDTLASVWMVQMSSTNACASAPCSLLRRVGRESRPLRGACSRAGNVPGRDNDLDLGELLARLRVLNVVLQRLRVLCQGCVLFLLVQVDSHTRRLCVCKFTHMHEFQARKHSSHRARWSSNNITSRRRT